MFARFGDLEFDVKNVGRIKTNYKLTYPSHALIGRKPKLQYTGMDSRKVSVPMFFHHLHCQPEKKRKELLNKAREHEAAELVLGEIIFGNFVIDSVEENFTQTTGDGKVLISEYTVSFVEYGGEVKAQKKAPAVKDKAKQTAAEAKKDRTEQIKPPKTPGANSPKEKATTPQQITRITT